MKIYKVVSSHNGFKELEKTVSMMLNKGWECEGGIAFNQGFCYQAMTIDNPGTSQATSTQAAEPDKKKPPHTIRPAEQWTS